MTNLKKGMPMSYFINLISMASILAPSGNVGSGHSPERRDSEHLERQLRAEARVQTKIRSDK